MLVDGKLINLEPEAYHGNPRSDKGSLVYAESGRDLLDMIKRVGFDVHFSLGANIEKGLFPDGNPVIPKHCWNAVFKLKKSFAHSTL